MNRCGPSRCADFARSEQFRGQPSRSGRPDGNRSEPKAVARAASGDEVQLAQADEIVVVTPSLDQRTPHRQLHSTGRRLAHRSLNRPGKQDKLTTHASATAPTLINKIFKVLLAAEPN